MENWKTEFAIKLQMKLSEIWRMLGPGNIIFQVLILVNSPGLIP